MTIPSPAHPGAVNRFEDAHETPDSPSMAASWSSPVPGLLRAATGLAAAGIVAFAVDVPVAAWCKDGQWPAALPRWLVKVADEIHRLVTMSEVFAHTVSVAVILGLVLALDRSLAWPAWRWPAIGRPTLRQSPAQATFSRLLGATFTGGILTDLIKLMVDRVRPRAVDFATHATVWDSFNETVIATITGSRSNINSFPSGHSAIAAGLAAGLAWKYPRGRAFFAAFAVMAAAQRIVSSAHFPSDACFGLALGLAGATLFLHTPPGSMADAGRMPYSSAEPLSSRLRDDLISSRKPRCPRRRRPKRR